MKPLEPVIEVSHLSKTFRVAQRDKSSLLSSLSSLIHRQYVQIEALRDINLHIRKGEVRALIGPNGAGKSSTIKALTGILYPTAGSVRVLGVDPWTNRSRLASELGVLFGQKTQLWWDLPALDTFYLHKQMYSIPNRTYQANLDYFIDVLSLHQVVKKPVRQLSLGERMKCEFICALLHEPQLVFLDEPTIGLDIFSKEAIRAFVKKVNREKGTTFIITTHDLSDIEDLCNNVTIINHGGIVFNDSIESLGTYFSSRKIVDIKFQKPIDEHELRGYNVMSFSGMAASIEVDVERSPLQIELQKLLGIGLIQDININNPSIESVIKDIYSKPREQSLGTF